MGLFTRKRQTQERKVKLPHSDLEPPASPVAVALPAETTIVYTGGQLSVTLQRAKSQFQKNERPLRLVWSKDQRLGLTFVELPQGGVTVKDVPGMRAEVSPGRELVAVDNVSVAGMSLQSVVQHLQSAQSPCVLDFTPPPSPIVVADMHLSASLRGVQRGMVLKAVNDTSMIGATLPDVKDAIRGASEMSPARLTFIPADAGDRQASHLTADTPRKSRFGLRQTLCLGALAAFISI
ncbi:hypothetical protein PHYBOEH_010574 [Phytophthora boehmeriae]|uniref:PDZ domain-containing protein n=1 Tax=Phytophthora boehmeriae TaxID=109152 RepID=A0A8T1WX78_9STRA|nr:hypothetical protein PHYBOEH_010574 [Phytophthora boehmeriae]